MDAAIAQTPPPVEVHSLFKKRTSKKSAIRKRPATPPPADSDSSSYDSNSDSGRRVKRQRKNALITATSDKTSKNTSSDLSATKFAAPRSGQIESTNDATKQSNWFESTNNASKTLLGTNHEPPIPSDTNSLQENDGTYKGASSYQNFIQKNPNAPSRQVGPIKAPTNIRTITVTDFAPDVCKDYKQTGFCGFGDSCKFLHAREDYKQGWELDKDWEIGTKGKKPIGGTKISSNPNAAADDDDATSDAEDAKLEGIPFACILCKTPYTNPIVTKCGHYFCEACALRRYRKNPACAACGAGTGGVFNNAKGLKRLLERKRERAKVRRERAVEEGGEVGSGSEDEGEGEGEG